MSKKLIHGIDLTAKGGIEALLDFHRTTFGDAQMNAGGDGGDGGTGGEGGNADGGEAGAGQGQTGTPPASQQATPPAGTASKADDGDEGKAATAWDGKIESLPAEAQKIITDLRKEAGDERVASKTLGAIQKALNPDAKDEKPDAGKLAQQAAEQAAAAKQAQTELAVYRTATKHGADADALLDSRAFLAKIADLDPSDTAKVSKVIEDAVKDNPKLKAVQAATKGSADIGGGSGEQRNNKAMSLTDAAAQHYNTN